MLEALILIVFSVALGDSDAIVNVVQPHAILGDIPDRVRAATSIQSLENSVEVVRPYFDASALRRIATTMYSTRAKGSVSYYFST
jgi:hypothetical protein